MKNSTKKKRTYYKSNSYFGFSLFFNDLKKEKKIRKKVPIIFAVEAVSNFTTLSMTNKYESEFICSFFFFKKETKTKTYGYDNFISNYIQSIKKCKKW